MQTDFHHGLPGEGTGKATMEPESSNDVKNVFGRRVERLRLFLSEVRNELKRVTWPSRKEVYATTVVVIVMSTMLGLFLWGWDVLLDRLELWILRRFGAG
jgi:preprotein translocase subunit SecE